MHVPVRVEQLERLLDQLGQNFTWMGLAPEDFATRAVQWSDRLPFLELGRELGTLFLRP